MEIKNFCLGDKYMNIFKTLFIIILVGVVSYSSNFLPYEAEIGTTIWLSVAIFVLVSTARKRKAENDMDRYVRRCHELFPVRLEEDAYHLSTMMSYNIPWQWVIDINELFKIKFEDLSGKYMHLVDSFCVFGEKTGSNLTRATYLLGKMLSDSSKSLVEHLGDWAKKHRNALGEEIASNCYFKHIQKGDHMPYGIFMTDASLDILATVYNVKTAILTYSWLGKPTRKIIEVTAARLCLRNYGEDNEKIVKAVHSVYPEFINDAKHQGSGPQSKGLFIQESVSVDIEDFRSRLPQLIEKLSK